MSNANKGETMSKIPEPDHNIQALIDKAHEAKAEQPRAHMGCSTLGHPCDRWLWLSFRWAVQPEFSGRILRLFRRGQMEEATIVSDLRAIGMDIRGTQRKVDFECHVSGSLDGTAKGVPGAPKTEHVIELKTHSLKSFNDLEKNGVEKSKPQHFTQCQVYMHGTAIKRALYVAVCKDDDRIYTERLEYDREHSIKAIERGQRLALDDRMPPPISTDASWYQCKFCDAHEFCHQSKTTKHVNCRTCAHSTAKQDSSWHCERHNDKVPIEFQRTGCDGHVLHPDLVPWKLHEGVSDWVAIYEINDVKIANGDPEQEGVYGSKELLANSSACASENEFISKMRRDFGGRIVG
jgi:hypothetical protein